MIFLMMIRALIAASLAATVFLSSPACAATKRVGPVKTGETAPDFTLTDQNGRSHTLSTERGKRAVVLVFYRGYW